MFSMKSEIHAGSESDTAIQIEVAMWPVHDFLSDIMTTRTS
jgi:hypothetical protein